MTDDVRSMLSQTYYQWKVIGTPEGETEPRLLIPWADPNQYEFAFDFMFQTVPKALEALVNWGAFDEAKEDNWVLVAVRETPSLRFNEFNKHILAEFEAKNKIERDTTCYKNRD